MTALIRAQGVTLLTMPSNARKKAKRKPKTSKNLNLRRTRKGLGIRKNQKARTITTPPPHPMMLTPKKKNLRNATGKPMRMNLLKKRVVLGTVQGRTGEVLTPHQSSRGVLQYRSHIS